MEEKQFGKALFDKRRRFCRFCARMWFGMRKNDSIPFVAGFQRLRTPQAQEFVGLIPRIAKLKSSTGRNCRFLGHTPDYFNWNNEI